VVYSVKQLSPQLWLIIDDESKADAYLNDTFIFGVLVVDKTSILQIEKENQPIYANETNLTEIIKNCTSVDTVVKFTTSQTVSFDIDILETNALTLDLCGFTVEFNDVLINNKGTLNLVNGDLVFDNNSQIYNKSKMTIKDVSIIATGTNNEFYALVNDDDLNIVDCTIKTDGLCCIQNNVNAQLQVDGGEYSSNVFSTISNYGDLHILSGNFYRESNDVQVGTKGTVYAVVNNLGTNAKLTIIEGNFVNEYLTMPTQRKIVVLNNNGGVVNIFDGNFQNKCNNKYAEIIYTQLNTAYVTINNSTMTVANVDAVYVSKVISTNKENIKIYSTTFNGSAKLNESNVTILANYYLYDYLVGATPKIILTNNIPTTYEASVNNRFYADVDMLTADDFVPNAVIRINKTPNDLSILLGRNYLGLENSFTIIYTEDMPEIVVASGDFVLQKIDCTTHYEGAIKAYQYYCTITESTATFKVVDTHGQVTYYSSCEFVDALAVASEIVFLKDLQLNSIVPTTWQPLNDLTIDLNGKTWTENGDVNYMLKSSNGEYTLTIKDGSLDSTGKMIFNPTQNGVAMFELNSSLVIINGTFVSNCDIFYLYGSNDDMAEEYASYTYEIRGGTFVGGITVGDFSYTGKLIILGGTFTFDPTQYLTTNYVAVLVAEGVYSVKYND